MLQQTFDLDPVLMNTTNNNEYGLYLQTIIVTKKLNTRNYINYNFTRSNNNKAGCVVD